MSTPNDPWATPAAGGPAPQQPAAPPHQAPGQAPGYGQAPAYGQAPGYGAAPAHGQAPVYAGAPQYGQPPAGPLTRPSTVRTAVLLMYVGAALSLISGLLVLTLKDTLQQEFDRQAALQGTGGELPANFIESIFGVIVAVAIVFGVIGAGLWIMNAVFCGRGRNWSRITATVLGGLYVLSFLISLAQPSTGLAMLVSVLTTVVVVATIVLLWLRPSNEYFAAAGAARRAGR